MGDQRPLQNEHDTRTAYVPEWGGQRGTGPGGEGRLQGGALMVRQRNARHETGGHRVQIAVPLVPTAVTNGTHVNRQLRPPSVRSSVIWAERERNPSQGSADASARAR